MAIYASADLIADAIIETLSQPQWHGRRLYLTGAHGLQPSEIFAALMPSASETVTVDTGTGRQAELAAIPAGAAKLVPYLVLPREAATSSNSGDAGFAATLRTQYATGPEPRILLVLAERPDETITSASDDAAALPALRLTQLTRRATIKSLGHLPTAGSLLAAIMTDMPTRVASLDSAARLDDYARLLDDHGSQPDSEIGKNLWKLGFYLADPFATPRTLADSRKWRSTIESALTDPSRSVERQMRAKGLSRRAAATVAAAVKPDGFAWDSFTRADLLGNDQRPPVHVDLAQPFPGARLAFVGSGGAVIAWLQAAGGPVQLSISRELMPGEFVRVRWAGQRRAAVATSSALTAEVGLEPPEVGTWRFGFLDLPDGSGAGQFAQPIPLAVAFSDGPVLAVEDGLSIEPEENAFLCGEQPTLRCWTASGRDLGLATLDPATEDGSAEQAQQVTGTSPNGDRVGPVPVLALEAGDPDTGGDPPADVPPVDEYPDDPSGPDDPGEDDPEPDEPDYEPDVEDPDPQPVPLPGAERDFPTFAHALHAARLTAWPAEPSADAVKGLLRARIGNTPCTITPAIGSNRLLAVEQATHSHPDWAQFFVTSDQEAACQLPLPEPEPGWAKEMASFASARVAYFAAASSARSAYAVDPNSDVATRYVDTYAELLWALPRTGRHRSEYDLLMNLDAIEADGFSELLVSPMSPLSVAYHASLATRLASDTSAETMLSPADMASFTMQWVVPLIRHEQGWWESVNAKGASLWRRYEVLNEAAQGSQSSSAQFIADRISFFLSVHPILNTPENTLAITCAAPGNGATVVQALRKLMATGRSEDAAGYQMPSIDLTLTEPNPQVRETLAGLAADLDDTDRVVRTRCNIRIQDSPNPSTFSHISFLFRTPGGRTTTSVDLDERSPTNYAGGLATRPARVTIPDADPVFATGVFVAEPAADATALERIQYRTLELVGGQGGEQLSPRGTRMVRATANSRQLDPWYQNSAWVVHLDRTIGIEAFAGERAGRSLLEYEEKADPAAFGYDGITATRYIDPYLAAMRRSIADISDLPEDSARRLMSHLESVSGRWTLQIITRTIPKVRERVGTACAVNFMANVESVLADTPAGAMRALVSLEELVPGFPNSGIPSRYIAARRRSNAPMCDDLLLLSVESQDGERPPLVSATVIEIKFTSSGAPNLTKAAAQVEETNEWLLHRYGPHAPARDLRGAELAELLRSAGERNSTFGLAAEYARDAEGLLTRLARGQYEFVIGARRGNRDRRGVIVCVESSSPAAADLSHLNGAEGPLDVIRLGRPWMESALHGREHQYSPNWPPLKPAPRPDDPPAPEGGEGRGKPQPRPGPVSPRQPTGSSNSAVTADQTPSASATRNAGTVTPSSTGHQEESAPAAIETDAHAEIVATAARLDRAFARYALPIEGFDPLLAQRGPSLIRYRTRGQGKLAIADVERRARDLSREVEAPGQLLVGDEPGYITVDVPRADRQAVPLSSVLNSLTTPSRPGALDFVAGVTPAGEVRTADLSRLPHLLVAGATGSGKSVFLRGLLIELLRSRPPEELGLMIVDPKRLDFTPFGDVPHLRGGILHDADEALERLQFTLGAEIDLRQPVLKNARVSSAAEFYEAGGSLRELPQLVIMIDEFADLVMGGRDRKGFSDMIQRYAQLTRAYGIYLVLATQRPSVDVITGSIKANLTARMAFALPSYRDSMTILDRSGAEDLMGDGDMLFYRNGRVERLQAPLATIADVREVTPDR